MKRFILLSCVIFTLFTASTYADKGYVTGDFKPTKPLVELFRELKPLLQDCKSVSKDTLNKILDPKTEASKISINDLSKIANEKFKRPQTLERRDIASFNEHFAPYDSNHVRELIKQLGDYETIYPKSQKPVKYILVNGSTINRMRKRVNFLAELARNNLINITPSTEIIFLTGDRDLYPEEKAVEVQFWDSKYAFNPEWKRPNKKATNEFEIAKIIWGQIDLPYNLRKTKINFINAKKAEVYDSVTRKKYISRPHTIDTLVEWVKTNKVKGGYCISVSNQPFVKYQELVIRRGLLEERLTNFVVEGVGPAKVKHEYLLAIYLDTIARSLNEITTIENLKKFRTQG